MQKNLYDVDNSKINFQTETNVIKNESSNQIFNSFARPIVDPEAEGAVDPSVYPEPKEATHKIRGKNDFIEYLFGAVDQELLTVKTFYFFFYSAFGSLFPLMGVYFKQMGMNAGQCGLLVGLRPFIEFFSAPFWGSLADRWRKGKLILLASLACWILFTLPLGFIQPPPTSCIIQINNTEFLDLPESEKKVVKRYANQEILLKNIVHSKNLESEKSFFTVMPNQNPETSADFFKAANKNLKLDKLKTKTKEIHQESFNYQPTKTLHREIRAASIAPGQSPLSVKSAKNYQEKKHKEWVKPAFSSIVYRLPDIQKTFFLLLLMVIVGEFFSAPAITLADSAVITLLGEDADRYGHQRMFGSLGWGLAMFFVGIALDHSTAFPEHPCGPSIKEKNYIICFAIFSVLMGAAFITATQMNFKYDPVIVEQEPTILHYLPTKEEQLQSQLSQQLNLPSLQDTLVVNNQQLPPEEKTKIFAQTTREIPEWLTVLKQFKDLKCISFLFVAWFMGFGIGLIFTFLFWHLQDYGGTPTLFGVASVINHISEIFAYFFSFKIIQEIGHVKVLCMGLLGNVIRFLYISWLKNPWWVLPFEFIQGITHATVWAACCSYIAHNTPAPLRSSAQGVLQGLHHGLGRGCGAVIGGIFVAIYGTTSTFRLYGLMCLLVLAAFIFINFYHKDHGFISNLPTTEDPHQVAEVTHLAPHGVPSNAIPRALSSHRLHELANQDLTYGATHHAPGNTLELPDENKAPGGAKNPFLREACTVKYEKDLTDFGNETFIRKHFKNYNEILISNYGSNKPSIFTSQENNEQHCTNPFHQHGYEW